MRTGTMILLGGAASLAIAIIGTFSTVHAGTVERVDRGGYFTCVRAGLTPDVIDWRCDVPQPSAGRVSKPEPAPEPEPEPDCGEGNSHHGHHGHGHGHGKGGRFASR